MTDHRSHLSHDDLVLRYYGDAGADLSRFDAHLAECDDCRSALDRLTRALSLVDTSANDDLDPAFEARVWARLAPALDTPTPWWGWARLVAAPTAQWATAGLAAAAIAAAFAGGWLIRDRTAPEPAATSASAPDATGSTTAAPSMQTRVLVVAVGDHLERTEVLLAELMNALPQDRDRDRAADLVAANRLFRQTAERTGDDTLDDVLGDIERVLVEVANGPSDVTAEEIAALRARVESRGILFRVRVLGSELRARHQQTPAQPVTKGKTS